MYFKPTPNVIGRYGFTPYSLRHTVSGNGWRIRDTEYYAGMTGAHVVQGFVTYPIDSYQLDENGASDIAAMLAKTDIDMFVNIGDVSVAPSREALSYNDRTIRNLIIALDKAAGEMRASFQVEFDKCTTAWEAAMLLDKFEHTGTPKFREIFKNMNKEDPFQWNGSDVTTTLKLQLGSIRFMSLARVSVLHAKRKDKLQFNGSWNPEGTTREFEFSAQANTHVLIDTEVRGTNKGIQQWLSDQPTRQERKATALIIRPTARGGFRQAEVDLIVKMLGNPTVTLVKDIPQAQKALKGRRSYSGSGNYVKRPTEEKLVWSGFPTRTDRFGREQKRAVFSRLCWTPEEVDLNNGGYYVELDRFTPKDSSANLDNFDVIINTARKLGLIEQDDEVYGLNEKEVAAAQKSYGQWINLFPYLRAAFADENEDGEMYSCITADHVFNEIGIGVRKEFVKNWATLEPMITEGAFKDVMKDLVELDNDAGIYDTASVNAFTGALRISRSNHVDPRATELPIRWRRMLRRYEMLLGVAFNDHVNANRAINYVNLIEAQ